MKIEKDKLELAARIFLSEQAKDLTTGEILTDKLSEVKLYKEYTSNKNGNAVLNMYLNASGKGWVVLATDNNLPAIWAESDEEITQEEDCPPFNMMMEIYLDDIELMLEKIESSANRNDRESVDFMKNIAVNQREWEKLFAGELTVHHPSPNSGKDSNLSRMSPLITTSWKQDGEYNLKVNMLCRSKIGGDGDYLVGCGAIALAQVLKCAAHRYNDYVRHIQFTDNLSYQWREHDIAYPVDANTRKVHKPQNMKDEVFVWESEFMKGEVHDFLRDVAVLMKSDFGINSTSTYIENAMKVVNKHINGAEKVVLISNNEEFWGKITNEIKNNRPVYARGTSKDGGGHAFAIDGIDGSSYHFNMGWGLGFNFWGRGSEYPNEMKALINFDLKNVKN